MIKAGVKIRVKTRISKTGVFRSLILVGARIFLRFLSCFGLQGINILSRIFFQECKLCTIFAKQNLLLSNWVLSNGLADPLDLKQLEL